MRILAGLLITCFASLSSNIYAANCPDDTDTAVINDASCTVVGSLSSITLNFNSGFTDNTFLAAVGGNPGTTLGQQRKRSFIKAAKIIADSLQYTVAGSTLVVDASFSSLFCETLSATLGSAGATSYNGLSVAGAKWAANTFYPLGLWSELNGTDQKASAGETADISADFNANIGSTGCLDNGGWYYGYDSPPVNSTGFVTVLLHEMTHGLGFAGLVNPSTGSKGHAWDDIYSTFLFDAATNSTWPSLNDGQRAASAVSDTGLLWNGSNVNARAIGSISAGFQNNDVDTAFTSGDKIQMFAPTTVSGGSSVSHFNTAVAPNELMEPQYTEGQNTLGLALYLLQDLGWGIAGPNTAPTLTAVNQTISEDVVSIVDISSWGFDADSDALTYSVDSCAANIICSISGTNLTLTPAQNHNGNTHTISIRVSDAQASVTDSFNLQVTAQNDDPAWTSIPTLELLQGNSSSVTLINYASDVDLDSLVFTLVSCGASLACSINANSLTISADQSLGMQSVSVQASDSNGGVVATSFNVNVSLNNTAPTFTIPNQITPEDIPLTLTLSDYSSDINNDVLSYALVSCGSNFSCVLTGDQLLLTPDLNVSGGSSISVSVSDGVETVSTAFSIVITAVNDAPVIDMVDGAGVLINSVAAFPFSVTDAESILDDSNVTLSATSSLNASISGNNLTMTPSQTGDFVVSIIASDGVAQTIHSFNVTVYDGLSLAQGGQIFTNGDTVAITNELHDVVLVGGSNSYNYQLRYEGQSVDELLVDNGGQMQIAMPTSGAFAGIYELTVTDKSFNETLVMNLVRPLRLVISSAAILDKDESQWIRIEGGAVNTQYTLSQIVGTGLTFKDSAGQLTNSFVAPDDSQSFNAATVTLLNQDVSDQLDITALINSVYSDITQAVSVFPGAIINVQVNDLAGQGIGNVALALVQHEHHQTYNLPVSYSTDTSGLVQLLIPDDQVAYSAILSAQDYMPQNVALIGSDSTLVVELRPAAIPMQISGQITFAGDLDFSLSIPTVLLTLDNGTLVDIPVTLTSGSQGAFDTVVDLNLGNPKTLTVTHLQADTVMLDLTGLTQDQVLDVVLQEKVIATITEPSPVTESIDDEAEASAGGDSSSGSPGYLLLCLLLLLAMKNKRVIKDLYLNLRM